MVLFGIIAVGWGLAASVQSEGPAMIGMAFFFGAAIVAGTYEFMK